MLVHRLLLFPHRNIWLAGKAQKVSRQRSTMFWNWQPAYAAKSKSLLIHLLNRVNKYKYTRGEMQLHEEMHLKCDNRRDPGYFKRILEILHLKRFPLN